jgi:hypothetical protein
MDFTSEGAWAKPVQDQERRDLHPRPVCWRAERHYLHIGVSSAAINLGWRVRGHRDEFARTPPQPRQLSWVAMITAGTRGPITEKNSGGVLDVHGAIRSTPTG